MRSRATLDAYKDTWPEAAALGDIIAIIVGLAIFAVLFAYVPVCEKV